MISANEAIWYIEYKDHMCTSDLNNMKNPKLLWVSGKIAQESDDFIAVVCCGTKECQPSSMPQYEIIFKQAITKKEMIHVVE